MAKKKRKLKPDTVVKSYWRDNGHFADFFNAVLFGGSIDYDAIGQRKGEKAQEYFQMFSKPSSVG